MGEPTIFTTRGLHTFAENDPGGAASAIAVEDGRVLAIGAADALTADLGGTIDDSLAEAFVVPGFVEAHSHHFAGGFWGHGYVGWFDRTDHTGRTWPGCRSLDDVIARLRELDAEIDDPTTPLCVWGFDPIYLPGDRLVATQLDRVSTTRPILVMHASIHLATVNTALMTKEGIDGTADVEGVPVDGEGRPIGELREMAAMGLAGETLMGVFGALMSTDGVSRFGELARRAGVTTAADLGTIPLADSGFVGSIADLAAGGSFPIRLVPAFNPAMGGPSDPAAAVSLVQEMTTRSSDQLQFGIVKLILDGSIQGFTARLNAPGYLGDIPNGQWLLAPEQVFDLVAAFHAAHITVHLHCNGDQAVDVVLEAVERAQAGHRWDDHRHTLQHAQLATHEQLELAARLGCCVNFFSNHLWYWGDQHAEITVGPERAATMNPAGTAMRLGLCTSFHCDAPVTPLGPLRVASCAVNRTSATGRLLGPDERISPAEALQGVTRAAAFQLRLDDRIGYLAPGMWADMAVLAEDPLAIAPERLHEVEVLGTVLGGRLQLS